MSMYKAHVYLVLPWETPPSISGGFAEMSLNLIQAEIWFYDYPTYEMMAETLEQFDGPRKCPVSGRLRVLQKGISMDYNVTKA